MQLNNRKELAQYFNTLGFKVGAEIGVSRGVYSEVLCQAMPGLKLYCVDKWRRFKGENPSRFWTAKQRLSKYNCTLIKRSSMEALKFIPDLSLDFVYIDANHYFDYVIQDIIEWSKKVRDGGIVSGHDYYYFERSPGGVKQAVDAYVGFHNIKLNVILGNPEATGFDEKHPNWWYVKTLQDYI